LRSGVLNEDGNFVHIYETTRQDLNNDNNIIGDPVTDDEATLKPVYTIPLIVPSSNIKVIESMLALTQDNRKSPLAVPEAITSCKTLFACLFA
jgi:hypothetical protein